jgi:hypothetical protein
VGLVLALVTMTALPRLARADLGDEPSKSGSSAQGQGEDTEKPKDSILDKKPADAAVASKNAQSGPTVNWYENWKFWAVAGGVVVLAAVTAFVVVPAIGHQVNGGDVRPCNSMFVGCFGEGQ